MFFFTESFGCQAAIPMEEARSHNASCIFKPNAILVCDKGCNMTITRRDYQENCFAHLEKRFSSQLVEMKKTIEDLRREQDGSKILISHQQEEIKKLRDEGSDQRQAILKLIIKTNSPPKCFWNVLHNMQILPAQPNVLEPVRKLCTWSFAQLAEPLKHGNSFFKIQILSKAENEYIIIALTRKGHEIVDLPGYDMGTLGYYDKGQLVVNGKVETDLIKFHAGDIIECGINFPDNLFTEHFPFVEVYVIVNSQIVSKKMMKMPENGFFPSIRMGSFTSSVPKVEYLYH